MYIHRAFGLNIESDISLPELALPDLTSGTAIDVSIRKSTLGSAEKDHPGRLRIHVPKIADFLIENGKSITYAPDAEATEDDLRLFLLGSCLGGILQQRGYIVLHGNAISIDGKTCRVVVGNRGAGKSTTAAWHYLQGAQILADDVCAIRLSDDGQAMVIPSYPQIKLWQTSADLLGIQTKGLRRIRAKLNKFGFPIKTRFQDSQLQLAEVVEINPSQSSVASIEGLPKITHLIQHSYRYHFLKRMGLTDGYTKKIIQLASMVKMQSTPRVVIDQSVLA